MIAQSIFNMTSTPNSSDFKSFAFGQSRRYVIAIIAMDAQLFRNYILFAK